MTKKSIILDELRELQIQLPEASIPFENAPNGYFESFSDDILTEIRLDSYRSSVANTATLTVPSNYFDSLPEKILETISERAFLESLPAVVPYDVPKHYFEHSIAEIIQNSQTANFLSGLPTQVPYQLPANYFEKLADEVLLKSSKSLKIGPLRGTRTFYGKLSIAASLFIILSISFLLMFHNTKTENVENQLALVSDAEINNYIQTHSFEFENELTFQSIDESKIDLNKLENDIYNSYFDDISEEEINNFL
ncbi:MAG: hypothetical protein IPJ31_00645 [Bacteroidetes bacterium]|nr:hypothetical protein [Bacteroidota bacterium]